MNGQLYKLAYVQKAVDRASTDEEREEVFRRVRTDSFRAFKTLAQDEDTPITKEPEQFTSSVVKRAKAALKKISNVEQRGEVPAVLEIQAQTEEAMIRAFDAQTRPAAAVDDEDTQTTAA